MSNRLLAIGAMAASLTAATAPHTSIFDRVLAQEKSFERRAAAIGIVPAFREYVAADAIMFLPHPVRIAERLDGAVWPGELQWRPAVLASSRDGTMVLSMGPSRWATGKGVDHGYYVTIWEQQADGGMRFVLDRGTIMARDLYALPAKPAERLRSTGMPVPSNTIAEAEASLARAAAKDVKAALSSRLDKRGRVVRDGRDPAIGPSGAERLLAAGPVTIRYDQPLKIQSARSGDLGYSYGKASWVERDGRKQGYWVRVWQHQGMAVRLVLDHLQVLEQEPQ